MPRLKIVTINILGNLDRWEQRREVLSQQLAALQPDLVALQEVNLRINNARWLAEQLGLEHTHITPKTGSDRQVEAEAILSRLPFEQTADLDLITQNRVAQWVQVRVDGRPFRLANGHFYWQMGESEKRLAQIEWLLKWLQGFEPEMPLAVCGDFNGTPDTAAIRRMRADFKSAYAEIHGREPDYTTPTPLPRSKLAMLRNGLSFFRELRLKGLRPNWRGTLDYIFINRWVRVLDCQLALNQPAAGDPKLYPSDHFGLAAELEVG